MQTRNLILLHNKCIGLNDNDDDDDDDDDVQWFNVHSKAD